MLSQRTGRRASAACVTVCVRPPLVATPRRGRAQPAGRTAESPSALRVRHREAGGSEVSEDGKSSARVWRPRLWRVFAHKSLSCRVCADGCDPETGSPGDVINGKILTRGRPHGPGAQASTWRSCISTAAILGRNGWIGTGVPRGTN